MPSGFGRQPRRAELRRPLEYPVHLQPPEEYVGTLLDLYLERNLRFQRWFLMVVDAGEVPQLSTGLLVGMTLGSQRWALSGHGAWLSALGSS